MILGFKDQFVPFVLDGSKTHTIRAGERWKVGMRADLFARPRQKDMRLLFREFARKVEPVEIRCDTSKRVDGYPSASLSPLHLQTSVVIGGEVLDEDERNAFAWRDGFRLYGRFEAFEAMVKFWEREHGFGRRVYGFKGQIIHWDYEQRFMAKPGNPKQRYCTSMMCSHYGEPINGRHSCAP